MDIVWTVLRPLLLIALCVASTTATHAQEPKRPVMGFDTYYSAWNGTEDLSKFGRTNVYCGATERFMLIMATNYIKDGLYDLGYDWMCISDGWQGGRDQNGEIYADTNKFPNGMAHTVEVLHALGFKVRLYTEVGPGPTCCGKVKSSGLNGRKDAQTFARWKIDGLTVDTCNDFNPDAIKQAEHEQFIGYLRETGADILYDLHVSPTPGQYSQGMADWMGQVDTWQYTTEWSTLPDVWQDLVSHVDMAATTLAWMRPGHSPNLLIIYGDFTAYRGNLGRMFFTFWSMFQSPLVVSEDFISYPGWNGAVFQTNRYCIAIDQDPLYIPPVKAFTNGANTEIWVKPLESGATALALLNRTNTSESIQIDMSILGVPEGRTYTLTDGWNNTNRQSTAATQVFDSPPNSVQLWILSPANPPPLRMEQSGGNVMVSWPASAPGCFLEYADRPDATNWTSFPQTPRQRKDRLRAYIEPTSTARYFRLAQ